MSSITFNNVLTVAIFTIGFDKMAPAEGKVFLLWYQAFYITLRKLFIDHNWRKVEEHKFHKSLMVSHSFKLKRQAYLLHFQMMV